MDHNKQDEIENLITTYQSQLKYFIRKRVSNKEDAEDILQDIWYQLAKTIKTAINPIEQISAWLFRVAKNTIINHGIKKREVELPYYQDSEKDEKLMNDFVEILFTDKTSLSPEEEYLRSLVWIELETVLSELPLDQREVFELTEFEGISVKEISQSTGISVNTLLSRKHYAILHLRKRMRQLYEDMSFH